MDPDVDVGSPILNSINHRLSELRDDIRDVRTHVDTRFGEYCKKIDELAAQYVTREYLEAKLKIKDLMIQGLDNRLKDLESERKRVLWLVTSSIIIAILALLFKDSVVKIG
jgi:uncharacterized alpha-E superfamily protein